MMGRLIVRLNGDIINVLKLHHYIKLENLITKAIKVEKQLKRKDRS